MSSREARVEQDMLLAPARPGRDEPQPQAGMRSPATFLELTAQVSWSMAHATYEELPEAARAALESLMQFFKLDRCAILRVSELTGALHVRCRVDRAGGSTPMELLEIRNAFPWAYEQVVIRREVLALHDGSELPAHAVRDRESFRRWGARSLLVVPIVANDQVDHILTVAVVHRRRRWPSQQVQRLHLVAERVVGALRRREQYDAREATERFERLLTDLSSRFAGARWDQVDAQIDHSLQQLLAFTHVDQCGFFTVDAERGESTLTHLASHAVTVPKGTTVPQRELLPWHWGELVGRGRIVCYSDPGELPREADKDRARLDAVSIESGVGIPYAFDGQTRYLLVVVVNKKPGRVWSARFVERLQVLGWVFASALNRKVVVRAQLKAAQDLALTRGLSQATLDALNEYVCVVDADGRVVEVNGRWRSLGEGDAQAPESVPVGGSFVDACASVHDSWRVSAGALAQGVRDVLGSRQEQFRLEYQRPFANGPRHLHTLVRRFEVNGEVYGAIAHTDISDRHRTQQELDELRLSQWHSDRVMRTGVLIASLAHELSQPLAAILSNSQAALRFLAAGTADPKEITEILTDIVEDDKRAARVIEALRRMLRRQDPERRLVDLCEVVRDMGQLLHSEFIRQHIHLDQECCQGSEVTVDRGQIQQVVLNLVMNGIEAMAQVPKEDRRLSIRVSRVEPAEVRLEVSDAGPGFSDEQLERPFQAFWTTKLRGTGLGLAICSSIVSAHGGHIRLERNPGGGGRVVVMLPAGCGREESQRQ